jgi:hypothetical protein
MSARYYEAPEVKAIALKLKAAHHPHLRGVRLEFLFSSKPMKMKGKEVWATMRKVSGLNAFLAGETDEDGPGAFFCMVVSAPIWEELSVARREALVDHELAHAWVEEKDDGSQTLMLLSHDCEDFAQIVARHGLYKEEISQFADVAYQAMQKSLYDDNVSVTFAGETKEEPERQLRIA